MLSAGTANLVAGMFWVGIAIGVIGGLVAYFGKGVRYIKGGLAIVFVGIIVVVLSQIVSVTAPSAASTVVPPAPNNAGLSSYVVTGTLLNGETWNQGLNTLYVYEIENTSSGALYTGSSNLSSGPLGASTANACGIKSTTLSCPNYFYVPIHSARTDGLNGTYLFPYTIASIPTWTSLGSSPVTCSFVGFSTATSTLSGQWKAEWSAGQNAGLFGTQNAPSVSTNVAPDPTAVTAFGSVTNVLHVSNAGGNSTSFGANCVGAITLYTSYDMVLSIGNSQPSTITVAISLIGEHA